MIYRGNVKNERIAIDEAAHLPEVAEVNVEVVENGCGELVRQCRMRRIRLDPDLVRHIASSDEFHPDEF